MLNSLDSDISETFARPSLMTDPQPPEIVDALLQEGVAAFLKSDWSTAERLFRRGNDLMPGHHAFIHNLGVTLHRQGRTAEAEPLLLKAAEAGAGEDTWMLLAQIYEAGGQDAAAFGWLKRILKSNPANAAAALALGKIKNRQGDRPGARECYRQALEADPGNITAAREYSNAIWSQDPEQAVAVMTRVLDAVAANPEAQAQILETLASQVEWWERTRRGLSQDHADRLDELFFTFGRDRFAQYEALAEKAMAANPTDSRARLRAGFARFCRGDRHGAEALFLSAPDRIRGTVFEAVRFAPAYHARLRATPDRELTQNLPPCIDVTPPAPDPAGVLYLACDAVYLKAFALPMLCSLAEKSPRTPVHLHIFDMPEAEIAFFMAFCKALAPLRFALSVESPNLTGVPIMEARNYYHSVRFIRLHAHLGRYQCPLWMTDVDALVNRDLRDLFAAMTDHDIAMRIRPGRFEPWNQFNASLIGASPTPRALAYHRQIAAYVADFHANAGLNWGIDQLAMYAVFADLQDLGTPPSVALLGAKAVDYTYLDDGFIWCNSGPKKFQHLQRLANPEKLPAANFEDNRFVAVFEKYWRQAQDVAGGIGWNFKIRI